MVSLLGLLNAQGCSIEESPIAAANLAELIQLIEEGRISGKIAKNVFDAMAASGKPPRQIVEEKGLSQVSDSAALEAETQAVLEAHPSEVERYKAGQVKLLGFFVGQVMQATKGKANPQVVNQILKKKLDDA
jgi:aspartyl-tRNA(Asn)/glutamyl-tRNA(Gln) amidotransferase subunit B